MMVEKVALAVVVAVALFLLALGGTALLAPAKAGRFLLGFAATPGRHYTELALRFFAGMALVVSAPRMLFPEVFGAFGWVLLATTLGLLLVPWQWHHRFASRSVPAALRFLPLIGIASLVFGSLVLLAAFKGSGA